MEDHDCMYQTRKMQEHNFVHSLMMLEGGNTTHHQPPSLAVFRLKLRDFKLVCFKSKSQRIIIACIKQRMHGKNNFGHTFMILERDNATQNQSPSLARFLLNDSNENSIIN